MTLLELMNIANAAYTDQFMENYYDSITGKPKEGSGDTLAKFVVLELYETFDEDATDEKQLHEAMRVMERAEEELHCLCINFASQLTKVEHERYSKRTT